MRIRLVSLLVMVVGMISLSTVPAYAASGCMSRAEFSAVHAGMSARAVNVLSGTTGRTISTHKEVNVFDTSYSDSTGYHQSSETDIFKDSVVSYRRCGGGRYGVSFDSYTYSDPTSGVMRSVFKDTKPSRLIFW